MKLAVVTLNRESIKQARRIEAVYNDADIYTMEKYLEPGLFPLTGGLKKSVGSIINGYDVIVFIMAMGIIVREVVPYIKHKSVDPAVLCLSVDGRFIIPVLSGHLGGANEFAEKLAMDISVVPVITTASDILNKHAVDLIAKENNLVIDSFKDAMDITAMMINNDYIEIISDIRINNLETTPIKDFNNNYKACGLIYISYKADFRPKIPCAWLIPKRLVLGIGARRGTSFEKIESLLKKQLSKYHLDIRAVNKIASIEIKKDENGIIELGEKLKVPFITYTAPELEKVVNNFGQSDFVKKTTGVGAVSMPSGYLGSNRGKCIAEKIAEDGVTLSIWEERV